MFNEMLSSVSISLLLTGTAFAHEHSISISGKKAVEVTLENEVLSQNEYKNVKSGTREILAMGEPENQAFTYKVGVNGFLRGEMGKNFKLPDEYTPGRSEGRFTWRVKPYAYWHPTDYLDIHVEGQGYGLTGGGQNFDRFSLYQGFVEARIPGKEWASIKGGRQEFVYGSGFIQGADTAFDGMTFDGLRLRLQPAKDLKIDLLGGAYATPFSGGIKGALWGSYVNYAPSEDSSLNLYVFRDNGAEERFKGAYLDTWGLRSTSKVGPFLLEIEPVFQTGIISDGNGTRESINAYGGHVDLTNEVELGGYKNTFALGYAVGSGSQDAADGTTSRKEFRNSNNDTPLVGDMHLVGDLSGMDVNGSHASGLQVYTIGWGFELNDNLSFSATGHKFIANYVAGNASRNIGTEADFGLTYKFNKDLSLTVSYDHFFTGKFFTDASGSNKDVSYVSAMLTFNLDRTKRKAMKTV